MMIKYTAISSHTKNTSYHEVEDGMGVEEDSSSGAELAVVFKNTGKSDKLDTGNVV
jgi:hypothetical protein